MPLKVVHEDIDQISYKTYDEKIFDHLDDGQLWQLFKRGNKAALAYLYQHYFFKLYNYGVKLCQDEDLVKDNIQELFIYLWKHKENLSETSSIKYYLYKSLRRSIYAQLKKEQRFLFRKDISEHYHFEFVLSPENVFIDAQVSAKQRELLLQALNQLPQRQKEGIFLRYYENLSPQEISYVMSLTLKSTYVLLSRAISFLKKHVDKIYWLFLSTPFI